MYSNRPREPSVELCPPACVTGKGENGYGFNLHSDKKKGGQFVRSVDPGSAAESADIRPGDRIVEVRPKKVKIKRALFHLVNGMNISTLRHSEVVALIREGGGEVRFLVVDQETYDFFQRIRITPTVSHVKEVYLEESVTESSPPTPSPTTELPTTEPPIINVTLTDSPITKTSPNSRTNGSLASHSSRSSTTQSEISSSDMSIQSTAAEAKKKALSSRKKKRAPAMNWSKKQEIFSSF
ncbi:hypothetical protein F7725_016102 [Dissostichus mawsoni]|uniref:PDZ domain-containing protein n=1 Tax=Dissostichus mawsoni TaxID=36200 RepID=A0A7J5Y3N6_DISMA|nr:hypothetical protein F7725_016102 [Dissostichus mawsoni]